MNNKYSLMEKRSVGGQTQLVIMDWYEEKIITLFVNELEKDTINQTLRDYIQNHKHILNNNMT